jgi:hypothetical protein
MNCQRVYFGSMRFASNPATPTLILFCTIPHTGGGTKFRTNLTRAEAAGVEEVAAVEGEEVALAEADIES